MSTHYPWVCITNNVIPVNVKKYHNVIKQEQVSVDYINARSVRNKTQEISDFIVDNGLDLLAITETWHNSGE